MWPTATTAFVLDAFGVLNVGDTPIPGAVGPHGCAAGAMGKRLIVLTNAASLHPRRRLWPSITASASISPPTRSSRAVTWPWRAWTRTGRLGGHHRRR